MINYVVVGGEGESHSDTFWDTTPCRWASNPRRSNRSLYLNVNEKKEPKMKRSSTLVMKISELLSATSSNHFSATDIKNIQTVRTSVVGSFSFISWLEVSTAG